MIEWLPALRAEVVKTAAVPLNGTVASVVAPSAKVTVPVGVPVPLVGASVAVKVTGWPTLLGLAEDVSVVVVADAAGAFTVMVAVAVPPLPASLEVIADVVLTFVPVLVPATFIENVQEPLAAMVAPVRLALLPPAVAVMVPPPQDPERPLGVATTRPAGRASVNPTPVTLVELLGLVMVKLSDVVPPTAIEDAPNVLAIVGAASAFTWMLADAGPPGPASVEVTVEVVLTKRPAVGPRTRTVMLQDWPAASTLDVLEKVPVPGLMLKIPPPVAKVLHVPPVCVTRVRPAGIVSLNATLVSGVTLGLVTVTVMIERPPTSIVDGLKLLEIVAGFCANASPVKDAVRSAAATSSATRRGAQVVARAIAQVIAQVISDLAVADVAATARAACRSMPRAAPTPRCDLIGPPRRREHPLRASLNSKTGGPSPTMELHDL